MMGISHAAETHSWAEILWASAVTRPDSQVVGIIVLAAAAHIAVVLVLINVTSPLPNISSHVIKAMWARRIDGLEIFYLSTIIKSNRGGVT